ncbi:hypothetical protein OS493_001066 [Desmophyllum pertusum]|uniref:Uncharacterized protein n=1 Tax=Desmophyllum pertusum TaxID=174260 RepID=A0A9W9ZTP5_9CNID|nr:hypothetical protein OS493_001066 [Desmophyllum pertusum]
MAEESGGASWWGSWGTVGTEFISSVRSKSSEAMTMVKKDLAEFVSTIHQDTVNCVEEDEEQEWNFSSFQASVPVHGKRCVQVPWVPVSQLKRKTSLTVATAAAAVTSDGPEPSL